MSHTEDLLYAIRGGLSFVRHTVRGLDGDVLDVVSAQTITLSAFARRQEVCMDAMRGLVACCERPGMILDTNTVAQLAKVRDALKQLDEFGSKVEQSHATRRSGYTTSGNGREDEKITEADQIDPTMPLQERFNLARAKAQQTAPSGVRYVTPPSVARLRAFLDEPEVDKGEPK